MGVRAWWARVQDEWQAAGAALDAAEERDQRRRAREAEGKATAGQCDQRGCARPVERDGKCRGCWAAIFGGVV